ncbi:MAG: biopolymer transporter ExbD [Candidatus Caenarcaniphilales bacterium]|nr:biopolymer transporter ExbD [Candidatus Caenarcaniphilales bacterium]
MSFSGGGRQRQTFSEINITPLTDVFLVLLVIMFLIAPLLDNQAALKVDPPAAQSAKNNDQSKQKTILIEVTKDGTIAVNSKVIADPNVTNDKVQDLVYPALTDNYNPKTDQEKPFVKLKADNQVDYGRVVGVLDAVNRAQLGKLSLITTIPTETE